MTGSDDENVVPVIDEARPCPLCGVMNETARLVQNGCRCRGCGLELAYVDRNAAGTINGVIGWLRLAGDIVAERYRVQAVLGRSRYSAYYRVEDLRLPGKPRILKETPVVWFDEDEAALLTQLHHRAIPDLIDRGSAEQRVYLVLSRDGSRTLAREREAGPIPLHRALPWLRQICQALTYLHGRQPPVIHRDLQPETLLLDDEGQIVLLDFGIAKKSLPEVTTRVLGRVATDGFSPPEQAMGTGTDERSDIYAMGAIAYALLTGRNPPAADARIAGQALLPPAQIVADMAPALNAGILSALSLNPNQRPQTVAEFEQVLDAPVAGAAARRQPAQEVKAREFAAAQAAIRLPAAPPVRPMSSGQAARRYRLSVPLILLGLSLTAVAAAVYLFLARSVTTSSPVAPAKPPPASVSDTGTAKPRPPSPVVLPTPAIIPPPRQTPAPAAGTAMEMLKGRIPDSVPADTPAPARSGTRGKSIP